MASTCTGTAQSCADSVQTKIEVNLEEVRDCDMMYQNKVHAFHENKRKNLFS
jgi:hypothetical protein